MKKVVLGLVALALSVPAMCTPITGDIAIAGASTYTSSGIHFNSPAVVLIGTDNFLSLVGSAIHLEPQLNFLSPAGNLFDIDPSGPNMDLLTLTVVENGSNFLNVKGTAEMSEAGYSTTLYDYTLTATRPDGVSSFTMTAVPAAAVPEPMSLLLVGSGLLGLASAVYLARSRSRWSRNAG